MLVAQVGNQEVGQKLTFSFPKTESVGNGGNDQFGIAERSQGDEADPVGKVFNQLGRRLQTQASFPNAAGSGEGQQTYP